MLMNSVGWELGQVTAEMAYLCSASQCVGPQLEELYDWRGQEN